MANRSYYLLAQGCNTRPQEDKRRTFVQLLLVRQEPPMTLMLFENPPDFGLLDTDLEELVSTGREVPEEC